MGLIRIKTIQAHPVPKSVGSRNPFDPGLFTRPTKLPPQTTFSEYEVGATAQNNMVGVPLFQCSVCNDVVAENEIPHHVCGFIPADDSDEEELAETDVDW